MIVKINPKGRSFKGVTDYLSHDKQAQTSERVSWSQTGNLHTDDLHKAARFMAWTDVNAEELKRLSGGSRAGRETKAGGIYHYSLSWHESETPSPEEQRQAGLETLERLGLSGHQYYMVGHNDTRYPHIHIVANLTHPETGKRHVPSFDKRKLQEWALEYEKTHGLHCKAREENAQARARGEQTKHQDTRQPLAGFITRAYHAARDGKAFAAALEGHGITLAQGRRGGLVIIDPSGDIHKLARQIDGIKTADIKAKLADLKGLPDAETLKKTRQQAPQKESPQPESKRSDQGKQDRRTSSLKALLNERAQPAAASRPMPALREVLNQKAQTAPSADKPQPQEEEQTRQRIRQALRSARAPEKKEKAPVLPPMEQFRATANDNRQGGELRQAFKPASQKESREKPERQPAPDPGPGRDDPELER